MNMMDNNEHKSEGKKKDKKDRKVAGNKILVFFLVLMIFTAVSCLLPVRPSYSSSEKRQLASFPQLTAESLSSGEFFDGINLWFADTFPLRDIWVNLYASVKSLYGFSSDEIYGDVVQGEEIPDETTAEDTAEATASESASSETTSSRISNEKKNIKTQTLGAIYVAGDSGYEFYNFVKSSANSYAKALNTLSSELNGEANLYDIIVPTSTGITLPDNLKDTINSSDQEKAINYMYNLMGDGVNKVDAFNNLMAHRNEYVYFRTDHHWTALGAYYAYEQLMNTMGKTPVPLTDYETVDYDNFLGTFYSDSGKAPSLAKNPDTVTAYLPTKKAKFYYIDSDGQKINWDIIKDVSDYDSSLKYGTFIGGDNSYSKITNKEVTDGSSCVVVKESFGNAFVPFLVAHYNTVHIIDYRYYEGNLSSFVKKNKVNDVILLNNISMTRNEDLIYNLETLL